MSSFKFPSIYQFPPFFTKQVHLDTANSQLSIWCKLVLEYCKHYHIWIMDLQGEPVVQRQDEFDTDPDSQIPTRGIFTNPELNRSLKPEYAKEIVNALCKSNNAEMINDKQFYVYYKTPAELANELLQWVENTGQQGNILTLYELTNGELTQTEFFHNMDQAVLIKVINQLVGLKRAVILKDADQKIMGVKIQ